MRQCVETPSRWDYNPLMGQAVHSDAKLGSEPAFYAVFAANT